MWRSLKVKNGSHTTDLIYIWHEEKTYLKKNLGKIKLWRLKEVDIKKAVKEQSKEITHTFISHDELSKGITQLAAKLCGVSKGGPRQERCWWWNGQVKKSTEDKKPYKKWQKSGDSKSNEL